MSSIWRWVPNLHHRIADTFEGRQYFQEFHASVDVLASRFDYQVKPVGGVMEADLLQIWTKHCGFDTARGAFVFVSSLDCSCLLFRNKTESLKNAEDQLASELVGWKEFWAALTPPCVVMGAIFVSVHQSASNGCPNASTTSKRRSRWLSSPRSPAMGQVWS